MKVQEDNTNLRKPILNAHTEAAFPKPSDCASSEAKNDVPLHHRSLWQRLGQSFNLVGICLFMRVLFVRSSVSPVTLVSILSYHLAFMYSRHHTLCNPEQTSSMG